MLTHIKSSIIKPNFIPKNTHSSHAILENVSKDLNKIQTPLSYQPQPVRKEFLTKITLKDLQEINIKPFYHFKPKILSDKIAYTGVKFLRLFADFYFREDFVRRAICLETIAAIPGLVGGMYRHLASLRSFKDNGDVIQKLLHEAENERQHLLTFLQIKKITFLDKLIINIGQPIFFNLYLIFYGIFPRLAHRFVGYLEEEAIHSYNMFEDAILKGEIRNVPAPLSAIEYWKLPQEAMLLDVVRAVRADEAAHRDANHDLACNEPFSLA